MIESRVDTRLSVEREGRKLCRVSFGTLRQIAAILTGV
jgi:hypothetical protein